MSNRKDFFRDVPLLEWSLGEFSPEQERVELSELMDWPSWLIFHGQVMPTFILTEEMMDIQRSYNRDQFLSSLETSPDAKAVKNRILLGGLDIDGVSGRVGAAGWIPFNKETGAPDLDIPALSPVNAVEAVLNQVGVNEDVLFVRLRPDGTALLDADDMIQLLKASVELGDDIIDGILEEAKSELEEYK